MDVSVEVVISNLNNADMAEVCKTFSRITGNSVTCKGLSLQIHGGSRHDLNVALEKLRGKNYTVDEIHEG